MILIIDNYDSFVFNIARYIKRLGYETRVIRNDAITLNDISNLNPDAIVLSPGPCSPQEAGISVDVVKRFSGQIPILGICLGHQCIGAAFGADVQCASEPMHGRSSKIAHLGCDIFEALPSPLQVGRYHSLIVELNTQTPLIPTAWSEAGELMAMRHLDHPTYGVQFHPESILTMHGENMIANFLKRIRA